PSANSLRAPCDRLLRRSLTVRPWPVRPPAGMSACPRETMRAAVRRRPVSPGVSRWCSGTGSAGRGRVDPLRACGWHVEVGLDDGDRRGALVAGDVHVPQARVEEAGAGPVWAAG